MEELEKILFKTPSNGNIGIGHVRWATHCVPNIINAHPHSTELVSVVHNGIIENSDKIKKELELKGIKFKSQTDTEVVTLLKGMDKVGADFLQDHSHEYFESLIQKFSDVFIFYTLIALKHFTNFIS